MLCNLTTMTCYLFMLHVHLDVFKVVVSGSQLTVEGGEMISGFVTERNLLAIGVKEDAAWYSPISKIIKLQYDGIDFPSMSCQVWAEEIGYRAVRCSEINGGYKLWRSSCHLNRQYGVVCSASELTPGPTSALRDKSGTESLGSKPSLVPRPFPPPVFAVKQSMGIASFPGLLSPSLVTSRKYLRKIRLVF